MAQPPTGGLPVPSGLSEASHLLTLIQGEASPQGLELRPLHKQLHALVTPNLLICESGRGGR